MIGAEEILAIKLAATRGRLIERQTGEEMTAADWREMGRASFLAAVGGVDFEDPEQAEETVRAATAYANACHMLSNRPALAEQLGGMLADVEEEEAEATESETWETWAEQVVRARGMVRIAPGVAGVSARWGSVVAVVGDAAGWAVGFGADDEEATEAARLAFWLDHARPAGVKLASVARHRLDIGEAAQ